MVQTVRGASTLLCAAGAPLGSVAGRAHYYSEGWRMRSMSRQRQKVYTAVKSVQGGGMERRETYSKPELYRVTVSATSGTPEEVSAGIVPTYDRYITSYDRSFREKAVEGMALWIDRAPQLDESGELAVNEDGTPVTLPDYTLAKILSTQRGLVDRYGITKIGGV